MTLLDRLRNVYKLLPEGVSKETKDKAAVEVIESELKMLDGFQKRFPKKPGSIKYQKAIQLLKRVIARETTFEEEYSKFENKYGAPTRLKQGGIIMEKGLSKFMEVTFPLLPYGALDDTEKDRAELDKYIEDLKQLLEEELLLF